MDSRVLTKRTAPDHRSLPSGFAPPSTRALSPEPRVDNKSQSVSDVTRHRVICQFPQVSQRSSQVDYRPVGRRLAEIILGLLAECKNGLLPLDGPVPDEVSVWLGISARSQIPFHGRPNNTGAVWEVSEFAHRCASTWPPSCRPSCGLVRAAGI